MIDVPDLPTMLVPEELAYYYQLGRTLHSGAGAMVEIGCWLGGGTVHLAAGLRDSGRSGKVVAIDRFVWQGELYERVHPAGLAAGADFEPLFRQLSAPLSPWIESRRAELRDFVWDGPPIEILVVDAPKQVPEILALLDGFGGSLLAGGSRIVFQDYLHSPSYALPAVLSLLGDALEAETVIPEGCLVTFRVPGPLALDDEQRRRSDLRNWTTEEAEAAFDDVAARLPDAIRPRMELSLAFFLHDLGATDRAAAMARDLASDAEMRWRIEKIAPTSLYWRYLSIFRAVDVAPERITPDMLVKLSILEHRAGHADAAIEACRQALSIEPGHVAAAERLAKLEARQRRQKPLSPLASGGSSA